MSVCECVCVCVRVCVHVCVHVCRESVERGVCVLGVVCVRRRGRGCVGYFGSSAYICSVYPHTDTHNYSLASRLQAREHFCQVIQVLKKKHQPEVSQQEQDSITVYTGTFNMGDAPPPPLLDSWLLCQGAGKTLDRTDAMAHDIYAIGTQVWCVCACVHACLCACMCACVFA